MIQTTPTDWHALMYHPGDVDHEKKVLSLPQKWERPRTILVSPTRDPFESSVPLPRILRVFNAMQKASWHTYQIVTSCSERLLRADRYLAWIPGIWMGVNVPSIEFKYRIDDLGQTGAAVKFISCEPLAGPLPDLDLTGIDWLIVSGDKSSGSRPLPLEWLRDVRDQCLAAGVLFCLRHRGGRARNADRELDGRTWDEMPTAVQVRSLPGNGAANQQKP